MTLDPLVSIIVPAFNAERYLRPSLDSIVAQTFPSREIIVMDDASSDSTPDIVREYGDSIRLVSQPSNRGQFANVNDGIALARGRYIAVYHADDIYSPTIVEREVELFQKHPELAAVFALDVLVDEEDREYHRLALPPELPPGVPLGFPVIFNALLSHKNRFLVGPTSMVAAWAYRAADGGQGAYRGDVWRVSSDLDMWIRLAKQGPLGIVGEHLIRYRHSDGQASRQYQRLRATPELHFAILDSHLRDGAQAVATARALVDHEAHRNEDWVFVAMRQYLLKDLRGARASLANVRLLQLWSSDRVQRSRVGALAVILRTLSRMKWSSWVAALMYRRWIIPRASSSPALRDLRRGLAAMARE
jgi:glycosyltransferase involved in cell wall biosynthesis